MQNLNIENMQKIPVTGHTQLTCLLGSPVSHSISPMMHNESFRLLGLDYIYLCFDVNEENLDNVVNGLRLMNVKGFNCTMPVKNKMVAIADELSPAASLIGAVNTVLNDNGKLIGHNTDGIGYMQSLTDAGLDIIGKKMTLMGAGGAASSILAQAALDGVREISIFSRKGHFWSRAEQMVAQVNSSTNCHATLFEFGNDDILYNEILSSDILTNATSVGMAPNVEGCLINDPSVLKENLIVSDIIYNPKETLLLRTAKEQGCKTINGLNMLLFQGAEAFKIWTGHDMPVSQIKAKYFSE